MSTEPTGNAVKSAVSGGLSNDLAKLGFWTIGRKNAGIVAIMVIVGIGTMTWISAAQQQSDLRMMSRETGVTVTKMLAGEVSGGVRWKKTDRIEASYADLVNDKGSTIANIVVWDGTGAKLTDYASQSWKSYDLSGVPGLWNKRLEAGETVAAVF